MGGECDARPTAEQIRDYNPPIPRPEDVMGQTLDFRATTLQTYSDVFTPAALAALQTLAPLNRDRRQVMEARNARRLDRIRNRRRIAFLDPGAPIPRTSLRVQDARDGRFEGSEIP